MTITGGSISGVDASFSKEKDEGTTATMTHVGTTVTASDTLTIQSGNDVNIMGSQVGGNTVKAGIGGNLHITSLQDTKSYNGDSSSISGGFSKKEIAPNIIASGRSVSAGTESMDSDYASVTRQAGIYAGEGGFSIHVGNNTNLKGAVIGSQAAASENTLDTGSLMTENIENKAEYTADSKGITLASANANRRNPLGASASMGIPMQGKSASTTYSAVADGIIKVAGKESSEQINHDTEQALNQLGEIFNRKDVKERQELAGLILKEEFTLIGDLAVSKQKDLLFLSTGDNLWENHKRFTDINNELAADWMDLTAWGKGVAAGAIGNKAMGPAGGVVIAIVVTTIESQKSEIAKREMEAKEKMEKRIIKINKVMEASNMNLKFFMT